jgi:hypothetical protein
MSKVFSIGIFVFVPSTCLSQLARETRRSVAPIDACLFEEKAVIPIND